jgi:hypothetical protein
MNLTDMRLLALALVLLIDALAAVLKETLAHRPGDRLYVAMIQNATGLIASMNIPPDTHSEPRIVAKMKHPNVAAVE